MDEYKRNLRRIPAGTFLTSTPKGIPELGAVRLYISRRREVYGEAIEDLLHAPGGKGTPPNLYFCQACGRFEGPSLALAWAEAGHSKTVRIEIGAVCWGKKPPEKPPLPAKKQPGKRARNAPPALFRPGGPRGTGKTKEAPKEDSDGIF